MERQMGVLSLYQAFHKGRWQGRSCTFPNSGFQMERQVAAALMHCPQTPMEGLVGVVSICGRAGADCDLLLSTLAILDVFTLCGCAAAS